MWDYAELSRLAKENGGPENFVNLLITNSKELGRKEALAEIAELENTSPKLAVVLGIGTLIGTIVGFVASSILGRHHLAKKQQEIVEKTRSELIEGIKAYDEAHPDPDENKEKKGEWVRVKNN